MARSKTKEELIVASNSSFEKLWQLIASLSEQELFPKKYFAWTGATSLGSYAVSATASHYSWAIKKIKKHQKSII